MEGEWVVNGLGHSQGYFIALAAHKISHPLDPSCFGPFAKVSQTFSPEIAFQVPRANAKTSQIKI